MRKMRVSGKSAVLHLLVLLAGIAPAAFAASQCKNQITMLPLRAMKAASQPRDFVRFKYSLTSSDSILIRSHEDTETSIGPYDLGFLITRDGKVLQNVTLRRLPEFHDADSL